MARLLTDEELACKLEEQQIDRTILDEAARRIRDRDLRTLIYTNDLVEAIRSSPLLDDRKTDLVEKIMMAVPVPHRVSSSRMSSIAAVVMRDPDATPRERSLAASVLSQDETPGQS